LDINERKRAEEALRTSESFLNNIIEQSPYPMWISDDKGTLIRLNQACQDLLHISEEDVVGKYNVLQDNIVEQQELMPWSNGCSKKARRSDSKSSTTVHNLSICN